MTVLNETALSANDVLLVPQYSDVESRLNTDLRTSIARKENGDSLDLDIPIMSSNMDTVTMGKMLVTMSKLGGIGCLHRFISTEEQIREIEYAKSNGVDKYLVSVGIKPYEVSSFLKDIYPKYKPTGVLVDIAHGHSRSVLDLVTRLVKETDLFVIAGNITTARAAEDLIEAGAHGLRVGVGPGKACSTRTVTGHGYPLLQAVMDIKKSMAFYKVPIIADGGIDTSGTASKLLAAGADAVCLGYLLACTKDSPGEWDMEATPPRKRFYGMSSTHAQDVYKGGKKQGVASEGLSLDIPYHGHTETFIAEFTGGIRSAFTYSGARTLSEFQHNAIFVKISPAGMKESKLL